MIILLTEPANSTLPQNSILFFWSPPVYAIHRFYCSNQHKSGLRPIQRTDKSREQTSVSTGKVGDNKPKEQHKGAEVLRCFRCGGKGHIARNCEKARPLTQVTVAPSTLTTTASPVNVISGKASAYVPWFSGELRGEKVSVKRYGGRYGCSSG